MEKNKVGLKQTTRSNYFYMYEHFVKEDFGWQKIQSIRRSDVRRFYNSMVDAKKLSMATLDNVHTIIHQLFKLAVEDNYIRINPSDEMLADCKRSHNYQATKRHSLTIPQQEAFIGYLAKTRAYSHWLPLFTFFLGTGCRVSEVTGIRWQDINMKENHIDINHNMVYYTREKGKCYFSVTTPKTEAGKRIIPMLSEVRKALENELAYNEEEMERAEKEKREPVLLPPFSCHNLRHTFATRYC